MPLQKKESSWHRNHRLRFVLHAVFVGALVPRENVMTKVSAYHTNSTEYPPSHRNVYHDHSNCPAGEKILPKHHESGTAGRPR